MDTQFWRDRWAEGRIGFHEGQPNEFLVRNIARFAGRRRVLVPLCGKTVDMAYLAGQGHDVVGVEVVEDAVRAFFAEQRATPTLTRAGAFARYVAGKIEILVGDFFAVERAHVGAVDAFYDRAAMIALPEAMRPKYVAHLRALAGAGAAGFIVTLEYDQAKMEGPPFSVAAAEVERAYADAGVQMIEDWPTDSPRVREADATSRARAYAVTLP